MSSIQHIYTQTTELLEFVQQFPKETEARDAFIAELNERLEQREKLIKQLENESLTEKEKALGQKLLQLNKKLTERLEQIRFTIRADISNLEKKKATGLKYENPYDGPTSDGVFFDEQR